MDEPTSTVSTRLEAAWRRHPLVTFARHRKRITFLNQLHSLVQAGIPVPTAFGQLTKYAPDQRWAEGLLAVSRAVRDGATLGDALRNNASRFDDGDIELIAFAEEAGKLEPILATLVAHLQQVQRQRWQAILGAMWPLYLAGAVIFVGPLLELPQQMTPGASVGALYTAGLVRSLITTASVFGGLFSIPFVAAAIGREVAWDRFLLRLPLIAAPRRHLASARLVLGLGLAQQAGMEMVRSLRLAARTTVSSSVIASLPDAEAVLRAGGTLTDAVAQLNVLDRSALGILSVAETTGTLDTALQKLGAELAESAVRAMRILALIVTALAAGVMLVKIVTGLLGAILGPIKTLYDAAGSGKLD